MGPQLGIWESAGIASPTGSSLAASPLGLSSWLSFVVENFACQVCRVLLQQLGSLVAVRQSHRNLAGWGLKQPVDVQALELGRVTAIPSDLLQVL